MHRSKFDVRGERAYSRAYPRWDHILEYRFDLGNFGTLLLPGFMSSYRYTITANKITPAEYCVRPGPDSCRNYSAGANLAGPGRTWVDDIGRSHGALVRDASGSGDQLGAWARQSRSQELGPQSHRQTSTGPPAYFTTRSVILPSQCFTPECPCVFTASRLSET